MKRQFTPLNPSYGREKHAESAASDEWLNADASNAASPFREGSPPQVTHRPAGSGLLSNWRSAQMAQQAQSHNIGNPAPLSMVDQDTVEQPIVPVQGSTTGPRLYTDIASSFVMGPVSPHQSGINSLPAMFSNSLTNSQTLQPLSSAPDHIPSQPLQPFGPYAHPSANPISSMHGLMPAPSPPLQPFGVQPIQPFAPTSIPPQGAWTNWPTTHTNSQSSPPPLPTALNKARKKKQRFPIWARVAVAMLLLLLILSGSGAAYYEANFAAPV